MLLCCCKRRLPCRDLCRLHPFGCLGAKALLSQGQLHEWNLDIFFRGVLCRNLEDDILLVLGDGLLADGLDKFAQPGKLC
jgi:hypothetical protein